MAKKKAARSEFNMSEAIRALLQKNPKLTGRELIEELERQHPGQKINRNSCAVAFSQARRKLGIRPGKKRAVRIKRPEMRKAAAATGNTLDIALLKSAAKFVAEVGDAQTAITAIQQLASLQIG